LTSAERVAAARTLVLVENLRYLSALAGSLDIAVTDIAAVVYAGDGQATPGGLARALAITTASATTLCDRLETARLLKRSPHPTDRRRRVLRLTARGQRLAQRFNDYVAEDVRRALSVLPPEAWGTILTFLNAMREGQATRTEEMLAQRPRKPSGTST
jgi:DNA-binding MarR family transcriptional regulator